MTAVATTLRSLLLTATGSVAVLGAVLAIRATPAGFADMTPGGDPGTGVNDASTAPLAPPSAPSVIRLSSPAPAPGDRRPRDERKAQDGRKAQVGREPRDGRNLGTDDGRVTTKAGAVVSHNPRLPPSHAPAGSSVRAAGGAERSTLLTTASELPAQAARTDWAALGGPGLTGPPRAVRTRLRLSALLGPYSEQLQGRHGDETQHDDHPDPPCPPVKPSVAHFWPGSLNFEGSKPGGNSRPGGSSCPPRFPSRPPLAGAAARREPSRPALSPPCAGRR